MHVWRLNVFVATGANSAGSNMAIPISNFEINAIHQIPARSGTGNLVNFYFYTIADNESLDYGRGFKIFLSSENDCTVIFKPLTRISL